MRRERERETGHGTKGKTWRLENSAPSTRQRSRRPLACLFPPPFFFYIISPKSGRDFFIFKPGRPSPLLSIKTVEVESYFVIHHFLVMLSMMEIKFRFSFSFRFLVWPSQLTKKKRTEISLSLSFLIGSVFFLGSNCVTPAAPPCPREHWRRNHSIHHQWCQPRCG